MVGGNFAKVSGEIFNSWNKQHYDRNENKRFTSPFKTCIFVLSGSLQWVSFLLPLYWHHWKLARYKAVFTEGILLMMCHSWCFNKKKSQPSDESCDFLFLSGVELEGFEPSSKQGTNMLSTCLFWPSVFVRMQDPDHQHAPYPLKSHRMREATPNYPRLDCTT